MNISNFLKKLDLEKVFFSSGFRNSHLLKFFNPLNVEHGFLDQSLAYQALGYSKASSRPAAICVTSGTAVSQTLSAVIEAYYSGTKLIVISADRPKRLYGSGAPQCIDQKNILKSYCRSDLSLSINDKFPSIESIKYPCHINIEIEEKNINDTYDKNTLAFNKPLFILNTFNKSTLTDKLIEKIDNEGLNVYQDLGSPYYSKSFSGEILLENQVDRYIDKFDCVIRFGSVSNARFWRRLDDKKVSKFHLDPYGFRGCESGELIPIGEHDSFINNLLENEYQSISIPKVKVNDLIDKYKNSEISFMKNVIQGLSSDDLIFCGNSMPIRYLKFFKFNNQVYFNRGANGIDGLISSAIGVAKYRQDKTVNLLIGDLSFIYDYAVILTNLPRNLKIYIFNNSGGRIFERVTDTLEIINEHSMSFESLSNNQIHELKIDMKETREFWRKFESRIV